MGKARAADGRKAGIAWAKEGSGLRGIQRKSPHRTKQGQDPCHNLSSPNIRSIAQQTQHFQQRNKMSCYTSRGSLARTHLFPLLGASQHARSRNHLPPPVYKTVSRRRHLRPAARQTGHPTRPEGPGKSANAAGEDVEAKVGRTPSEGDPYFRYTPPCHPGRRVAAWPGGARASLSTHLMTSFMSYRSSATYPITVLVR